MAGTAPAQQEAIATISRGEAREQAIVDATLGLLGEIGYEALTMDAVAARAKASKATIYRRWPGKPELVGEALRRCGPAEPSQTPRTGSLRGDLIAMLGRLRDRFNCDDRALLTGLLHAMAQDSELGNIMRTQMATKRSATLAHIQERARSYDIDPVGIEQVAIVMPGSIMMRLMVTNDPVDDEFITGFVDDVLMPLLTRSFDR